MSNRYHPWSRPGDFPREENAAGLRGTVDVAPRRVVYEQDVRFGGMVEVQTS